MACQKLCWLLVALACVAPPQVQGVSPVQKVIALIDEMVVKVKADLDTTVSEFETYSKFADESATEKEYALKSSQKSIEALNAAIVKAKSTIDTHDGNIADLGTKISGTTKELEDAVALREKEHADFLASEKQLITDVEAINTAVKETSFAQLTPDAQRGLDVMTAGLAHVVDSGFVMHAQRSKVAAFLQAREDSEDEEGSPQGGTLGAVQERAEAALKGARETEQQESFAFSSLKMNLENEIKGLNKEMAEATHGKQRAAEELAQSQKDLAVEKSGHADDEAFMRDLQRDYNSKGYDFEVEFKDATAELKALGSAKAILEKKFASLLQASARTTMRVAVRASDDHKAAALRMIQQLGKRLRSTALVALAYRAAGDPFGKVRGMIEDMLTKLQQEAAEAATQEAFCNEERGKSMKSKQSKEQDLAKLNSRMEKAESAVSALAEQISMLSKEIKDLDVEMTEATEIRAAEKAAFTKIEKDLSESKDACSAATQVLRDYYENSASLLQVRAKTRTKDGSEGGGGILSVLEYAAADFEKQLSDERVGERQAESKFETFHQDSKMLRAMKDVEVKSKRSESKSLKTQLNEYSEDKEGTSAELQAVLDYLDELKPKCASAAPPSYAEKKAKRESEIQGLKEALKILE